MGNSDYVCKLTASFKGGGDGRDMMAIGKGATT